MRILIVILSIIVSLGFNLPAYASTHVKKILIVMAMEQEAKPIIKKLKLKPANVSFQKMPMRAYTGKYKKLKIFLMLNGQDPIYKTQNVGTQPAALSTYLGIEKFHPDLVISLGTAGALKREHIKPGSVFISKKIDFYSRRIPGEKYEQYGIGNYSSFKVPHNTFLKPVTVCSGDAFDQSRGDYAMFLRLHCNVIEMEAASVAWVSQLNGIPMLAMKGVTNNVESQHANKEFHQNFDKTMRNLANNLSRLLNLLST